MALVSYAVRVTVTVELPPNPYDYRASHHPTGGKRLAEDR